MEHAYGSSSGGSPEADRQILAELDLPDGPEAVSAVRSWLLGVLGPLELQPGFLSRILDTARDVVIRITESGDGAGGAGHFHILIFSRPGVDSTGKTWGFFLIEKVEAVSEVTDFPGRSIEFYLYVEGQ